MAAIAPTKVAEDTRYEVWDWALLTTTNNVGAAIPCHQYADITLHVRGTFGGGGQITMMGNLALPHESDFINRVGSPLEEEVATPIILATADTFATVRNAPLAMWPSVTGGDGTTSMTVRAVIRR